MHTFSLRSFLAVVTVVGITNADEIRLVDGRILVGNARQVGQKLEVATREGTVTVAQDQVLRVRKEAELQEELAGLAAATEDNTFGHLQVAKRARELGLTEAMWSHLDACCQDDRHPRLQSFLADLEPELLGPELRKANLDTRLRELLFLSSRQLQPAKKMAIEVLLSGLPEADTELRQRARKSLKTEHRSILLRALARRGKEADQRFLARTLVVEPSAQVRQVACEELHRNDPVAAVNYLAPGLVHEELRCRLRTAQALGELSHPAAVDALVAAVPAALKPPAPGGDGSTRAFIAVTTQVSYIRDYDVEVAQSSFIADPKVDIAEFGSVLDVKVMAVTEHRYLVIDAWRKAIRRALGSDPGPHPEQWAQWLAARKAAAATPPTGPKN